VSSRRAPTGRLLLVRRAALLMQEKRDGEARSRNNRDCCQHNDDKPIFFAHWSRTPLQPTQGSVTPTKASAHFKVS
jgi:hypothetical protein